MLIKKARKLIEEKELVVYPTDTLYGLGGDATSDEVVKKVFDLKERPYNMPISIALSDIEEIEDYCFMNDLAYKIAEKFLPGAITIILKKKADLPELLGKEKIGIRIPANEIARKIVKGMPITSTSANKHGMEEPKSIEIAKKQLGEKVALYIDNGILPGKASTIIDVSEGRIKILREGAISKEEIYGI
ncbi:MAG: threonylcarbamoyl-AMP synthase [Thermoplasmatales archaeon]|nr:threonylcarbamoyl-AMP synthase [Thermoplasmatales archaeon]